MASDLDGDGFGTHPQCARIDCDDMSFGVHPGATEACNGLDEDCDGAIDEDLGESFCGAGACQTLVRNCIDGRPSACLPSPGGTPETCNGIDDDCDGETDEGLGGDTCGVGECESNSACEAGAWSVCTPDVPTPELCNGLDDDCNGVIDEGFAVRVEQGSYFTLSNQHPECDGAGQRMGTACNAAIHRHCAASDCNSTGFGPLENSGDFAGLACVSATEREVPYITLAGIHWPCDGVGQQIGPDCNAAMHRWCRGQGFATGHGPAEVLGDRALVACLSAEVATVVQTSYSVLSQQHPGCTTSQRWGPDCNAAINRFCAGRGDTTGFGPVENSGDTAVVVCVRP